MAIELLRQIEEAEAKAEEVRQEAAREARETMKAAEEAALLKERQMAKAIREEAQKLVETARLSAESEIGALGKRRATEREAMKSMAMTHVEKAGNMIFERIVRNGNR